MGLNSYLDLDLLVEAGGGRYRARVLDSPVGQATHDFSLPFTAEELQALFLHVYEVTSAPPSASARSGADTQVRAFGSRLLDAVFDDQVGACVLRSMDEAGRSGQGLRIRLRLDDPDLSAIPWEFLYSGTTGSFLCLSDRTPLVRYVELPERIEPIAAQPPLMMLSVISSPAGAPPLDIEHEWAKLREALREPVAEGRIVLDRLADPTLEAFQRRLQQSEIHIVHFVGHGGFSEASKEGLLLLQDGAGQPSPVGADQLGVLLRDHDSLRLVVLNACEGARQTGEDPFAGLAQNLVRSGIPAVIGMQFQISDRAAITFAGEFYGAIADGFPVDASLAEARKALFTRVSPIEWATPVLFMRAPDGQIFDIGDRDQRIELRSRTEAAAGSKAKGTTRAKGRRPSRRTLASVGLPLLALLIALVAWRSFSGGAAKIAGSLGAEGKPAGALGWSRLPALAPAGPGAQWVQKVLAEGPAGLVAVGSTFGVGDDAAAWTSTDGSAWSPASGTRQDTFRSLGKQTIYGIAYGTPGYVAVGYDTNGAGALGWDAAVWTSTDGGSWSRVISDALGGESDQEMNRVRWTGSRFVAVGFSGRSAAVWSSADGTTWARVADAPALDVSNGTAWMRGLTAQDGSLYAVGAQSNGRSTGPAVWTSIDDGDTWASVAGIRGSGSSLAAVVAGPTGLVAVGHDTVGARLRAAVWFSSDGRRWDRAPPGQPAFSSTSPQDLLDVAVSGGSYVAVGYDGRQAAVWTSTDGRTWSETTGIPPSPGPPI